MAHFAYRQGLGNTRALLVVGLIVSLISTGSVNTALGIDAPPPNLILINSGKLTNHNS